MRIPGPIDLLRLPGRALDAVETTLTLVPRLAQLVRDLDLLVSEARVVVAAARATQTLAHTVAENAEQTRQYVARVAGDATATRATAAVIVDQVGDLAGVVQELLVELQPAVTRLTPLVHEVAAGITSEHVDAAIQVIEQAPGIVDKLTDDVLPVLDSLETVAPDLREVLDVSQGMEEMLGAVPGLGRVKRRVESQKSAVRRSRRAESDG